MDNQQDRTHDAKRAENTGHIFADSLHSVGFQRATEMLNRQSLLIFVSDIAHALTLHSGMRLVTPILRLSFGNSYREQLQKPLLFTVPCCCVGYLSRGLVPRVPGYLNK